MLHHVSSGESVAWWLLVHKREDNVDLSVACKQLIPPQEGGGVQAMLWVCREGVRNKNLPPPSVPRVTSLNRDNDNLLRCV